MKKALSCRSAAELTNKYKKTQDFKNDMAITFPICYKIIMLQSLAGNGLKERQLEVESNLGAPSDLSLSKAEATLALPCCYLCYSCK